MLVEWQCNTYLHMQFATVMYQRRHYDGVYNDDNGIICCTDNKINNYNI